MRHTAKQTERKRGKGGGLRYLAINLCAGALFIWIASLVLAELPQPVLEVRLRISESDGGLVVVVNNASARNVAIDLTKTRCFLVPVPQTEAEYVAHIDNGASAELRTTPGNVVVLEPGIEVAICDITRQVASLPGRKVRLSAVLTLTRDLLHGSECWEGLVRSPPLDVAKT